MSDVLATVAGPDWRSCVSAATAGSMSAEIRLDVRLVSTFTYPLRLDKCQYVSVVALRIWGVSPIHAAKAPLPVTMGRAGWPQSDFRFLCWQTNWLFRIHDLNASVAKPFIACFDGFGNSSQIALVFFIVHA